MKRTFRNYCGLLTLALVMLFLTGCLSDADKEFGENLVRELANTVDSKIEDKCRLLKTSTKLPKGKHPKEWINEPRTYWNCSKEDLIYRANGTFTTTITESSDENFENLMVLAELCGLNPFQRIFEGRWVVSNDKIYARLDIMPGYIGVGKIILEPDGHSVTTQVSGELSETCYLIQE